MKRILLLHCVFFFIDCSLGLQTCELDREPRRFRRIVGGGVVPDSEHPWAVNLFYDNPKKGLRQFCGGTLLENGWVLTAAHCIDKINTRRIRASVYFGKDLGRRMLRPLITLKHVDYKGSRDLRQDIGLIRLRISAEDQKHLQTACVARNRDIEGRRAKLFGWGLQHEEYWNSTSSMEMKEMEANIYHSSECFFTKNQHSDFDDKYMVCAGHIQAGQDACKGDSGSGLMIGRNVVGVVSWGLGCGRFNRPSVFARVSSALDWLENVITSVG
eukprot:TRINITY_DN16453_c0_g1_i2.p1 TRINITY_DN16453_c0_g1~~TRINITY_DN16453_c0_g1_i2.p1  ORF type:complete len:279 (-),score=19.30 TRINITY_DN16453_c0_g1_i2:296-1108(-)